MLSLASVVRKWLRPRPASRRPRPALGLECLEGRSLPSVTPLHVAHGQPEPVHRREVEAPQKIEIEHARPEAAHVSAASPLAVQRLDDRGADRRKDVKDDRGVDLKAQAPDDRGAHRQVEANDDRGVDPVPEPERLEHGQPHG